jgi:transketolase
MTEHGSLLLMRDPQELADLARVARVDAIKALWAAQSGHPGSSLSAMEAMITIYFGGYLKHNPKDPTWAERDIFILSQGHAAPGYYACLALAGYLDRSELATFRHLGTRLEGHIKRGSVPGIECSSGSLGQGLNFGTGVALALQRRGSSRHVFVMMSDGEQQEGSTWEGVMFAGSHQLTNLTALVDANGNQINGPTHQIMPIMDRLPEKYAAFGWAVHEVADGNDVASLQAALDTVDTGKPNVIISHSVTGKGVSYMEGDYHWHHGKVTDELFLQAMKSLGEEVSPTPDETWAPGTTPVPHDR